MFVAETKDLSRLWTRIVQYYSVNFRSYDMHPHTHRAWEIMLVVSGSAYISYQDGTDSKDSDKELTLHEGDFIVIDSYVSHRLHVPQGAPCRMLNIELEAAPAKGLFSFESLEGLNPQLLNQKVIVSKDNEACLHSVIISLQQQLKRDKEAKGAVINWIIGQLILTISRLYTDKPQPTRSYYVKAAEEFMSLNFDSDITVDMIAEHVGISRAYLQRLYKESRQKSIIDKINELRINKAKFLLISSSLSIVDIAVNVGFNNRQHFTHIFSRSAGCSPGEFRKKEGPAADGQIPPSKLYTYADGYVTPHTVKH